MIDPMVRVYLQGQLPPINVRAHDEINKDRYLFIQRLYVGLFDRSYPLHLSHQFSIRFPSAVSLSQLDAVMTRKWGKGTFAQYGYERGIHVFYVDAERGNDPLTLHPAQILLESAR